MKRSRSTDIAGLVMVAALVCAAAVVGSLFSGDGTSAWYRGLQKPAYNPPAWVFGPVWMLLYVLIAVSGWLVWLQRDRTNVWPALGVFVVQLVLNALWSLLFFGLHRPDLALVDIALLLAIILVNILVFWRLSRTAGLLLAPYAAWVAFATILNLAIWRLNP